jgi:protoporphyrinogen oxidase
MIKHILRNFFIFKFFVNQKKVETSLIDEFLYPKFGSGQMYQDIAEIIKSNGGEILLNHQVFCLTATEKNITEINIKNLLTGEIICKKVDYVISSMPIKNLMNSLAPIVSKEILDIANGLCYRDLITVGLLLNKLKIKNTTKIKTSNNLIPDNWIYIQEKDVKLGRLQIFNNWSPYAVSDPNKVWLGLEYFGNFDDDLFSKNDEDFKKLAIDELAKIDIIDKKDVLDACIIRVPKAYPAYFGTYDQFFKIRDFLDEYKNLFLVGRNGMHKYNNMDHSILSGFMAADNIINGISDKNALWSINTEEEYHEESK